MTYLRKIFNENYGKQSKPEIHENGSMRLQNK